MTAIRHVDSVSRQMVETTSAVEFHTLKKNWKRATRHLLDVIHDVDAVPFAYRIQPK